MVKGRGKAISSLLLTLVWVGLLAAAALAAEVPRMTKEELKPLLGSPEIILLDVRVAPEWNDSGWKIQGATRQDPKEEIASWAKQYPKEKTIVLYCS